MKSLPVQHRNHLLQIHRHHDIQEVRPGAEYARLVRGLHVEEHLVLVNNLERIQQVCRVEADLDRLALILGHLDLDLRLAHLRRGW